MIDEASPFIIDSRCRMRRAGAVPTCRAFLWRPLGRQAEDTNLSSYASWRVLWRPLGRQRKLLDIFRLSAWCVLWRPLGRQSENAVFCRKKVGFVGTQLHGNFRISLIVCALTKLVLCSCVVKIVIFTRARHFRWTIPGGREDKMRLRDGGAGAYWMTRWVFCSGSGALDGQDDAIWWRFRCCLAELVVEFGLFFGLEAEK